MNKTLDNLLAYLLNDILENLTPEQAMKLESKTPEQIYDLILEGAVNEIKDL